ncbi:MAG: FAD-dependent oxidoreductase [Sulfurovum sp.]|uniref:FAD-dependent oxidoreductase n=1 Tax=Sulfurovum sp. TaxID=1969726 RepID=UPI0028680C9F|nr:FAD-dependent oxidoreductase [Sulfurovum sp.]MCO4845660.1 FAD-dependent oxidoreductase [Sulfurovum sp.]
MSKTYDSIIIGAGISGASTAHAITQKGQKVLVLDKRGIASGGSGAAGAFVSPKIGKGSPLQTLTNTSFSFAKDFYLSTCPTFFHQTGVIRIPKDEADAKKFSEYEPFNKNKYENYTKEQLQEQGVRTAFESFYFPEAGACDAKDVCKHLFSDIEVVKYEVKQITREDGLWNVGEYSAKNLVLATGYESDLADLRYMGIKGTWGTRGDFSSKLSLDVSMHQSMSVGANVDGIIKLGATHEKEVKEVIRCKEEQALLLKEKASSLIDTSDLELKETFCGMRSGSKDYFPLVGKVIDVPFMLETYPAIIRGSTPEMKYIDNLFICNGLGGRGFVFAPLMAKILSECIIEGKEVDVRVDPDRLFLKWCRKSPELDALR